MGKTAQRTAGLWLKLIETTRAEKELMGDDGLSLDGLRKLDFPDTGGVRRALSGDGNGRAAPGCVASRGFPQDTRTPAIFFRSHAPTTSWKHASSSGTARFSTAFPEEEGSPIRSYFRSDRFYPGKGSGFWIRGKRREKDLLTDRIRLRNFIEYQVLA